MKQIIYVASFKSQQIHVWNLEKFGTLTLLQIINTPGQVQPMIIHPEKKFLYIGIRPKFSIVCYCINNDGTLKKFGISLLPASPTYISIDMLGQYLFSVSYHGNCLSISKIFRNGTISNPIKIINNLITPHSVNINVTNQMLFIPCLKKDSIYLFNFNKNGTLIPHKQKKIDTSIGAGPRHMVFHSNGKYAYCINELNGTVDVLKFLEIKNKYMIIQTCNIISSRFVDTHWASDIHITHNNKFLYTSERNASVLSIFRISKDGSTLYLVENYLTELQPRGFNIDFSDQFIISAGQKSNNIGIYKINQDSGKLKIIATYSVGKEPIWVSVLSQPLSKI
ncbi:6-phosphogluconolactonase [Candidatus Ecksteinia adelgidicola]|nr:6-phosphogluconolactonase [Candidatus Ecksteinia adelgidicola]